MASWKVKRIKKQLRLRNPLLIEGLPGVGNVGKIAVDYLIDTLKAEKVYELISHDIPHCVFVNEHNLVELPEIGIYQATMKGRTVLLLAGDVQPVSESSCFDFCHKVLGMFGGARGEVVTLGGIALPRVPKDPLVYCTGNSKRMVEKYKSRGVKTDIHGRVGPIVVVSGVLVGLAGKKNIPGATLLAETFGHPNYIGIRGARNILRVLKEQLKWAIELSDLDDEVNEIEEEIAKRASNVSRGNKLGKKGSEIGMMDDESERDYI